MKKQILCLASVFCLAANAQETPHVFKEDTIIIKSKPIGLTENWDFSDLTFTDYPNTSDSDLVRLKDPIDVYANHVFININDSVSGQIPQKTFSHQNVNLVREGFYTAIYEGHGTVKIPGQIFNDAEKIKIVERYTLKFTSDSLPVASYTNIYYTFFNKTTRNQLISVFKKKRTLKGNLGDEITGIGYSVLSGNNANSFTQTNIGMVLNPNPASINSVLNYNLVKDASVKIEITNQLGTINDLIFNGNKQAGSNQKTIPLNQYQSGLYNIKLIVDGQVFSQSLIIQ